MLATPTIPMPSRLWAYAQMMRPANIVTAWADILVGYGATGLLLTQDLQTVTAWLPLLWLLLATTGLYGGGVVFNDVFDAELDAIERPERPIPSGRAPLTHAIGLGAGLLLMGIVAAAQVSWLSAAIAFGVAIAALSYDAIAKHHPWFGPLNMGLCRGGNWLLGMSVVPAMLVQHGVIAIVPMVYIAAITLLSRGEVNGGDRGTSGWALGLLIGLAIGLVGVGWLPGFHLAALAPFGLIWLSLVLPKFIQAVQTPTADVIRLAVRTGVISLIALDSALASGSSGWMYGGCVLILLPVSRFLAQRFAVT
jgi:4-hydroxybenzoate polyprenyltransferase